jgi:hypothetical protein
VEIDAEGLVRENKAKERWLVPRMTVDLYSEDHGVYTINSFRWPRIWALVCAVADDILDDEQISSGYYNDGIGISMIQSVKISDRLKSYTGTIDVSPPDHVLDDMSELESGAAAMGASTADASFSREDVNTLAAFMKSSGGFTIS